MQNCSSVHSNNIPDSFSCWCSVLIPSGELPKTTTYIMHAVPNTLYCPVIVSPMKIFRKSIRIWEMHELLSVCISIRVVCRFSLMFATDYTTWQGKMTVVLRSARVYMYIEWMLLWHNIYAFHHHRVLSIRIVWMCSAMKHCEINLPSLCIPHLSLWNVFSPPLHFIYTLH